MPNAVGMIQESIWRDPDFRQLSRSAQTLYLQLLSQKELDCAGMLPLQADKWATGCNELSVEQVWADLDELQESRFVYYDRDTYEALIRTHVRHSNTLKVPNMRKSAIRSASLVGSDRLRRLLAIEFRASKDPEMLAAAESISPSESEPFANPSVRVPEPTGKGMGKGVGVTVSSYLGGEGENAPRPQCSKHDENSEAACRACMRRREWDENHAASVQADELEHKRAVRLAIAQARQDCPHCDEDGWAVGDDGTPVEPAAKCQQHEAAVV